MPNPNPNPDAGQVYEADTLARFQGHWYPDEPHRGCAFCALMSNVNSLDPLLLRAAEATGQRGLHESFVRVFADAGEVTCWVRRTHAAL